MSPGLPIAATEPAKNRVQIELKDHCEMLRKHVQSVAVSVRDLADNCKLLKQHAEQGELIANAMLAFRHLEDARMRLGKVIQAYEGGVSCYDAKPA